MYDYTIIDEIDSLPDVLLDVNLELNNQKINPENQQNFTVVHPRLACKVNIYQNQIILSRDGRDFDFTINDRSGKILQELFFSMDGTKSISELQQMFSPDDPEEINTIVQNLDARGLLDDVAQFSGHSGMDTLLELEDLTNELLNKSAEKNLFWKPINSEQDNIPLNVIYGFAIETYHFFSRKCYFDSPVLGFQNSTKIRQLINQFYCQEYGQDELLLKAINTIGISQDDLTDTLPLPQTMAICNGLAYWARFEPLFFFNALGVLAGQTFKNLYSYIKACERVYLDTSFIDPIRHLAKVKLKREQENLTRRIFQEIANIDEETRQRLKSQTYLFIEMYNNFYSAIWKHYSSNSHLLRQVSAL